MEIGKEKKIYVITRPVDPKTWNAPNPPEYTLELIDAAIGYDDSETPKRVLERHYEHPWELLQKRYKIQEWTIKRMK
jgi:hypothetical protein